MLGLALGFALVKMPSWPTTPQNAWC